MKDNPTQEPERDADDLAEEYGERAAIMEFDGGLPRAEAERRAREIVYGRVKATA